MSIIKDKTVKEQSTVAYLDGYAIVIPPTINTDHCSKIFVARKGTTTYPCHARIFDDVESAMLAMEELENPRAQVVRVVLQYVAEVIDLDQITRSVAVA
jgi:hypothetical protein